MSDEACAHARMWARTHEVFAAEDAARREQLDRWIREAKADGYDPTDGLCSRGHPLDGVKANGDRTSRYCRTRHRERMREATRTVATRPCVGCGAPIGIRGTTGLCSSCWGRSTTDNMTRARLAKRTKEINS